VKLGLLREALSLVEAVCRGGGAEGIAEEKKRNEEKRREEKKKKKKRVKRVFGSFDERRRAPIFFSFFCSSLALFPRLQKKELLSSLRFSRKTL